eukprot:5401582-Amphidinium_carterae.1
MMSELLVVLDEIESDGSHHRSVTERLTTGAGGSHPRACPERGWEHGDGSDVADELGLVQVGRSKDNNNHNDSDSTKQLLHPGGLDAKEDLETEHFYNTLLQIVRDDSFVQ